MRHSQLQEFVMDMFAISSEYRASAYKSANHGQCGFKDRQPKRNHGDRDSNYGWRFLRTTQGERAEHESNKKASAIAEKNRGWIEVEAKKTENRAYQR